VAAYDYAFVLTLSGHARDTEMLIDLLRTVLEQAGYSGDTRERLVTQVTSARATVPSPQRCDVRFESRGGELQIVVSQAGRDWRTTCPLLTH
jgi:hypothetical protein